jgi:hypothetical protein
VQEVSVLNLWGATNDFIGHLFLFFALVLFFLFSFITFAFLFTFFAILIFVLVFLFFLFLLFFDLGVSGCLEFSVSFGGGSLGKLLHHVDLN